MRKTKTSDHPLYRPLLTGIATAAVTFKLMQCWQIFVNVNPTDAERAADPNAEPVTFCIPVRPTSLHRH